MFGRKKVKKQEKKEDLKQLKEAVTQPQPVETTPAPAQQPKSLFLIAKRVVKQQEKMMYSESGQQIPTGQTETISILQPVIDLSINDIIDIVANCKDLPIGIVARELLKHYHSG